MAIQSMFYNIVIPIENLKKILNKKEIKKALSDRGLKDKVLFDDNLYSEGSMSPCDNEVIIKFWEGKGLTPTEIINGEECWKDLCLIQSPDLKPTLPCSWIEIFQTEGVYGLNNYIGLKGKARGELINDRRPAEEFIVKF